MKKFITSFILVVVLVFSSGCAEFGKTTVNALSVVTTSTNLVYYYDNGEVVDFIDKAKLTDLEIIQVIEALDQADRSRAKLQGYKDNPALLIENIAEISFQYVKIKGAYMSIRSIVHTHWDEYTEGQRQMFLLFDKYALQLDTQFAKLNQSIETNQAIATALALASTGIKMASLL